MAAIGIGLAMFAAACTLAIIIGIAAQRNIRDSHHQSLRTHSSYVRFMQDKHELNRFGYAQQLFRRWSGFDAFGSSFTTMAAACGAVFLIGPAVTAGGMAVVGWGWPLLSLAGLATACSLAAMASAIPTAGGCYHWASALGGRRLGLAAGWFHLAGNVALLAATNFLCADWLVRTAAARFGVEPVSWADEMILLALFASQLAAKSSGTARLGKLFAAASWAQVALVAAIVAALAAAAWPGVLPAEALFSPGQTWAVHAAAGSYDPSFLLGLMLLQKMFLGCDSAAASSEETADPRISTPWAIYLSAAYTFIFGFVLLAFIALHFTFAGGGSAWFANVWGGWGGAAAAAAEALVLFAAWSGGLSAMTAASRALFALARDDAAPMAKALAQVSGRSRMPAAAAAVVSGAGASVSMIAPFWMDSHVVNGGAAMLIAMSVALLHSAYAVPIGCKLATRFIRRRPVPLGPWQIGKWGDAVDGLSLLWLSASAITAICLMVPSVRLVCCVLSVCGLALIEALHRQLRKKGPYKTAGSIRFTHCTTDELIRIERKFPQ